MAVEILIIDDEEDIRDLVSGILEDIGYETRTAATSEEADSCLNERLPSLVILDVWLKGSEMDGLELLNRIKRQSDVPVIMISGHGTVEMAASALKMGAEDFLQKPFEATQLTHRIERALHESALKRENQELQLSSGELVTQWLGESTLAQELSNKIKKLTESPSRLLIWGERGVGKATVARLIYKGSVRSAAHFNILNCANASEVDFRDELLGIEENEQVIKIGVLEDSHNGVLLLEDIDLIPENFQSEFAKILQSGCFTRVGGKREVTVNVRVMATSLLSPEDLLERGVLQKDLYHRLNVNEIFVPPLRLRRDDIIPFFHRFVSLRAAALRCPEPIIEEGGLSLLQIYDWLGNLRQMRSFVERLLGEGRVNKITTSHIESCLNSDDYLNNDEQNISQGDQSYFLHNDLRTARNSFEKEYLQFHLQRFGGNIAKTADFVKMERTALHRKLKSLDLL